MKKIRDRAIGKGIITFLGFFTAVSPYLADWNITHIYNPAWPPHAKFHNAQTMVLGAFLGILTLYCLWFRTSIPPLQKLREATTLVSLYWVSQIFAIFFPGTMLQDPGPNHLPKLMFFGVEFTQIVMDFTLVFPLIILGFYLENKRLNRDHSLSTGSSIR